MEFRYIPQNKKYLFSLGVYGRVARGVAEFIVIKSRPEAEHQFMCSLLIDSKQAVTNGMKDQSESKSRTKHFSNKQK